MQTPNCHARELRKQQGRCRNKAGNGLNSPEKRRCKLNHGDEWEMLATQSTQSSSVVFVYEIIPRRMATEFHS